MEYQMIFRLYEIWNSTNLYIQKYIYKFVLIFKIFLKSFKNLLSKLSK